MTKKTRQAFINQAVHNMKQSVKILEKKKLSAQYNIMESKIRNK